MKTIIKLYAIAEFIEKKIKETGFAVNYEVRSVFASYDLGTTHETIIATDVSGENSFDIFTTEELNKVKDSEFNSIDAGEVIERHIKLFSKWDIPRLN